MITSIDQLDLAKRYTYSDYLNWQFEEMVELIRGKVFKMSPAPNRYHQEVSGNLYGMIWSNLKNKTCKVFSAPFDVRLPLPANQQTNGQIDTVVQPDLCVVCNPDLLDEKGCNGAPDWIIEILSIGTASKDLNEKFSLYESAGVGEYWIVHPSEGTVLAYHLQEDGHYQLLRQTPYTSDEKLTSKTFPDLSIDLSEVFTI